MDARVISSRSYNWPRGKCDTGSTRDSLQIGLDTGLHCRWQEWLWWEHRHEGTGGLSLLARNLCIHKDHTTRIFNSTSGGITKDTGVGAESRRGGGSPWQHILKKWWARQQAGGRSDRAFRS